VSGEIAIFPAALLDPRRKDEVILFLRQLPVPPNRKKEALVAWCRYVGVALDRDMVRAILGPLERWV